MSGILAQGARFHLWGMPRNYTLTMLKIGGISLGWMIIAALWSYVDEATKPWIQGRHFSWFDVGPNLFGTFIGGAVVLFL